MFSKIFQKIGQTKKFQMMSVMDLTYMKIFYPNWIAPMDLIPWLNKSLHTKFKTPPRQWCQFWGFYGPKSLQSGCWVSLKASNLENLRVLKVSNLATDLILCKDTLDLDLAEQNIFISVTNVVIRKAANWDTQKTSWFFL